MKKFIVLFSFLVFVLSCASPGKTIKKILDDFPKPGTLDIDYNYLADPAWSIRMCFRDELAGVCIAGKGNDEDVVKNNLKIEYNRLNSDLIEDIIIE